MSKPNPPTPPDQDKIDLEQAFLLYTAFCGDAKRTAHALRVPQASIEALAVAHNWGEQTRGLVELVKTEDPGSIERGLNRAGSFVQAHRMRAFLDRCLRAFQDIADASPDGVRALLTTDRVNRAGEVVGTVFTTRCLADLASAMEKVHWMAYMALNDSPQERVKRAEKPAEDVAQSDIHAKISSAMARMRAATPRSELEAAQAATAAELAVKAIPPA